MNKSIKEFYEKNPDKNYADNYDKSHGKRIDFIVKEFGLDIITKSKILDVGCGLGNFFKRMNEDNEFFGVDGAEITPDQKLCNFKLYKHDLNLPFSKEIRLRTSHDIKKSSQDFADKHFYEYFDLSICSETLEHLENPYRCLIEIKKLTKTNNTIILTIPDAKMTHNTIYPGLMFPNQNFEMFLSQMALPIEECYFLDGKGYWPTRVYKCRNAKWEESKMLFYKQEEKFRGITPVEATNI